MQQIDPNINYVVIGDKEPVFVGDIVTSYTPGYFKVIGFNSCVNSIGSTYFNIALQRVADKQYRIQKKPGKLRWTTGYAMNKIDVSSIKKIVEDYQDRMNKFVTYLEESQNV